MNIRAARVLELAGPSTAPCGRFLADVGLDVAIVEPPGGAEWRRLEDGRLSPWSSFHDANKRSIELDLAGEAGVAELVRLIADADVLVEGTTPGTLERRGLGYERLREDNPGLVLASITPFGQNGPYSGFASNDLVSFAMGGVMFITGEPERPPVVAPDAQSFVLAGAHAALAVLAALWRRADDGAGEWIDVSMHECWAAQENTVTNHHGPGKFARRAGSQHRTALPGRIFPCADGYVHLFISREERVWTRFIDWIGRPEELSDPRLATINWRWEHAALVEDVTTRCLSTRTQVELFESAQELHLPVVPIYSPEAFAEDRHTVASAIFTRVEDLGLGRYWTPRSALPDELLVPPGAAPLPGEDGGRDTELAEPDSSPGASADGVPVGALIEVADRDRVPTAPAPNPGVGGRSPRVRRLLDGIRVCAFTHVAAGPYATLQLAYLGAEVIKVESRTRIDYWRYRDRNDDPETSRPFMDHNKNVRSVTLNLGSPEGRETARTLATASDVVIDNFSVGVTDRLGLGYDDLRASNAIVVHMSGLGSTGPRRQYVTFGPSLMAYVGLTHLWNHPGGGPPVGSQSSYPDYLAGVYTAYATLAALHRRRRTGEGMLLDLSQVAVAAMALGPTFIRALNGDPPSPIGNTHPLHAPHGAYPCVGGDDDWCVIAVESEEQWRGLLEAMDRPAWAQQAWCGNASTRIAHRAELDRRIAAWTVGRTAREVMMACQARGVPAGMVATGEDVVHDPHLRARGFLVERQHARMGRQLLPGSPVRMRASSTDVWRFGPLLGEDQEYILVDVLGLDADEIDKLEQAGALE